MVDWLKAPTNSLFTITDMFICPCLFVHQCCELLDAVGVPYIKSCGEAERLCAALNAAGVRITFSHSNMNHFSKAQFPPNKNGLKVLYSYLQTRMHAHTNTHTHTHTHTHKHAHAHARTRARARTPTQFDLQQD